MNSSISEFINSKHFAIAGISRNDAKFGNMLYRELKARSFSVIAIHPTLDTFDGDPCYKSLSEIKQKVDALIINVGKDQVKALIEEAHNANISQIWLQQGSESPETIELAKSYSMNVISGKCILMYAEPVTSFHKFHRFIWKLIKQY